MNIYEARVPENQTETKISAYLSRALPLLSERALRDAFKNRDVKQNGVRVSPDAYVLRGAVIQVYTPFEAALPVVYEDEHILLIDKPAGISVEDDARGGMTVMSVLTARAGERYIPRLCHRLDNQTSGLLALAKDDDAEKCLLDAFKNRDVEKRYECLVRGVPRQESAVMEAYLVKDAARARVRVVTHNTPEAKPIRTAYEVIEALDGVSRLSVELLTGRTHQIRAHMAFLAHPILGDDLYGDRAFNKRMKASRLMLCARELTFRTQGALKYLDGRSFLVKAPF